MNNPNTGTGTLFKQFSSSTNQVANSTNDFFQSNSLIAKIAFLLLVVFLYIILLRAGIYILGWFSNKSTGSPKIINGMVDAKQLLVITQDPSLENSITINRSINASDGIEFTWSVWIFIDDLTYNSSKYKCVFYKGNDNIQETGLNFPNNAPGLYIAPNTNDLVVIMNTFSVINEEIMIPDIPLNKWINVIIRCKDTTLDIYINGIITKAVKLMGVPKQNYGDVYIAMDNGFSGYISNLAYYNYSTSMTTIREIMQNGPNTKVVSGGAGDPKNRNTLDYLSLRWYFYGSQ
jgi:hypothetical protein